MWKLSGSYSIGLNGTTASASVRYTVASDAKMYYIDTDGVITKIDDVKNISSDSTATYIGLLDVTDGDIATCSSRKLTTASRRAPVAAAWS